MKAEKKSKYGLYAFRLNDADKAWLDKELDRLKERVNKGRRSEEKVINKNDIILEALRLGFPLVRPPTR